MVASVDLVQMDFNGEPKGGPHQILPQGEGHRDLKWVGSDREKKPGLVGTIQSNWTVLAGNGGQVKPSAPEK